MGNLSKYSENQKNIFIPSLKEQNISPLKSSSRILPLNDSILPFSQGLPGLMYKVEPAASFELNHGIPVLIVSRRLGHSKPSITLDIYGHVIPSKQEEAAALMDELMSPIEVTNCTIFAPEPNKKP